jgi:hypothetical protein
MKHFPRGNQVVGLVTFSRENQVVRLFIAHPGPASCPPRPRRCRRPSTPRAHLQRLAEPNWHHSQSGCRRRRRRRRIQLRSSRRVQRSPSGPRCRNDSRRLSRRRISLRRSLPPGSLSRQFVHNSLHHSLPPGSQSQICYSQYIFFVAFLLKTEILKLCCSPMFWCCHLVHSFRF